MNKIYKITWNHSRAQYMVTHEHTKSHRKGRLCAALIGSLLGASMLGMPLVAQADGLTESTIQKYVEFDKIDAFDTVTATKTENGHQRFDITPDRVVHGNIGLNHFRRFELKSGDMANLYHADGSSTLVNFVNQQIQIDGTVNSIVGSQIGGDLFFVSPMGMTVGTTGVINTGSLTAIAADYQQYLTWVTEFGAHMTPETLAQWQTGEVPLSRNATITVKGSINAGNSVTLAAGNINVAKSAKISTKVTDFSNLVNITAPNGSGGNDIVLASDITNGQLTGRVDASGDVVLTAIGDTKYFDVDADGKPTGAGKFYEKAEAKIQIDGVIESRKNIKASALAGSGTYDSQKTLTDGTSFIPDSTNVVASVNADVTVTGQLKADGAVTVTAKAENHFDNSGASGSIQTATTLLDWVLNNKAGVSLDAGFADLTTNATVNIEETAELVAAKGPLTLTAVADTNLIIGASTDAISTFNKTSQAPDWYTKGIPSVSATVGLIDNEAKVTVKGDLQTGGHLTLGSQSTLTAEVTADVGTIDLAGPEGALVVGKFDSNATTEVVDSATITISDEVDAPSAVNLYAQNTNSVATTASASIQDGAYVGVVMNYTELNSGANVWLHTPIINEASSINITAANLTKKLNVKADTGIGPFAFVKRIQQTKSAVPLNFLAGLAGKAAVGIDTAMTPEAFRMGGAVGVFIGHQDASVLIDAPNVDESTPGLRSRGDVTIKSLSNLYDHQFYANSRVVTSGNPASKGQASLALFVTSATGMIEDDATDLFAKDALPSVSSTLDLLNDTTIVASNGNINLASEATISWSRMEVMKAQFKGVLAVLDNIWAKQSEDDKILWGELWTQVQQAATNVEEKFNAVGTTETLIGDYVLLSEAMGSLSDVIAQFVTTVYTPILGTATQLANLLGASMSFASPTNYVNTYVASGGRGHEGAFAAAGAIGLINQWTSSQLTIGKNVKLQANGTDTPESVVDGQTQPAILRGRINVNGRTQNESVMLVGHLENIAGFSLPNIQSASAVGAALAMQTLDTTNVVRVREGAELRADNDIHIDATDDMSVVTIGASSDITSGTLGLDMLAATSLLYGNNVVELDDEIGMDATNIVIEANRDDDMQTIAGTLMISHGDSAALSAGAALAINHGELNNTVQVKDNDQITAEESSIANLTGQWHAKERLDVSADSDVAINAIGVAGAVSMATQGNGALTQFGNWLKPKVAKPLGAMAGAMHSLKIWEDLIVNQVYQYGDDIHQIIATNQTQNANTNDMFDQSGNQDPGRVDLTQQGQNGATTTGANTQQASNTTQASALKMSAAASLSLNQVEIDNAVDIDVSAMTIDVDQMIVEALVDKWIGTWAGTAAVNYMGSLTNSAFASKFGAGLAGAFAVNTSDSKSTVSIKGDKTDSTGITIRHSLTDDTTGGSDVRIYAVNDGTILTEGLTATGTTSGSVSVGATVNASVNMGSTDTETTVEGITLEKATNGEGHVYDQAAWVGDTQVTGGTGLGFTTSTLIGKSSNALGFIAAVADIDNTVKSVLKDADMDANRVDVRALSSVVQVTTAVNAQVAGTNSTFGFSGTAGSSLLSNAVEATVSDASIHLTGNSALMQVIARDATDEEHSSMDALTEEVFAFDKTTYVDSNDQTVDEKTNQSFYENVEVYTDDEKTLTQNVEDFLTGANMVQSTTVISLAVTGDSSSSSGTAIGAGVLVNDIDNVFTTNTSDVTVTRDATATNTGFTQSAESNVVSVGVTVGAAGSGGAFSAAGSVIVSDIDQKALSHVDNLSTETQKTDILAGNDAISVNVAGNVGVSVGSTSVAVGAAVAVANTRNDADITINQLSVNHDFENGHNDQFKVNALNKAQSWGVVADAGISNSAVVGGSVLVNRVKNDTAIDIDGLSLDKVLKSEIRAEDATRAVSLGGNVAVSGYAGLAGVVLYTLSGGEGIGTHVSVNDVTVTNDGKEDVRSDLIVEASAEDHVISFATGVGVSTEGVGLAGVASTNDIDRDVEATLADVTSVGNALKSVSVVAQENADIDNGSIVASASSQAALGIGIAVNRIDNRVSSALSDHRETKSTFSTDSLRVVSHNNNDIDTVGVGGGGAGVAAIGGSVAVNLITSDTLATVDGAQASMKAGVIEAVSDDTIGNYGGQAYGAGTAAGGLTVTVSERKGTTKTEIKNARLTETTGEEAMTMTGGVSDADIQNGAVKDVSSVASLSTKRGQQDVNGLAVGATSTSTIKTVTINAAGSGVVTAEGTNNVVYHGGSTELAVSNSTIDTADGVQSLVGDYVAVDTSMTTAGGSQVQLAESVNVTTTDHQTQASFADSTISGKWDHQAEGKESLSHLILSAGGSIYATVSPAVNVNRFLSDVSTTMKNVTVKGQEHRVKSTYLADAIGGSGLLNGAAGGAVGANVNVNYFGNDVTTSMSGSELDSSQTQSLEAERKVDVKMVDVSASGAIGAATAYVNVNTIEGQTKTEVVKDSTLKGDATSSIMASNVDEINLVGVTGQVGIGAGGTNVVVNNIYGDALVHIDRSTVDVENLTVVSRQDRDLSAWSLLGSGGGGVLQANVVANNIGSNDDPFVTDETGLEETEALVNQYVTDYASVSSPGHLGVLETTNETAQKYLTSDEQSSLMKTASTSAALTKPSSGTTVSVASSTLKAENDLVVKAEEDKGTAADINVVVGSGTLAFVAADASVATLRYHHAANVAVDGSTLSAKNTTVGTYVGGDKVVGVYQGSGNLVSGLAAYSDIVMSGGGTVSLTQTDITSSSDTIVENRDDSEVTTKAFGVVISAIAGGGTVGHLRDQTASSIVIDGFHAQGLTGRTSIRSVREGQRLADVTAGFGGAIVGVGGLAKVYDDGSHTITVKNTKVSGSSLTVDANNQMQLSSDAGGYGGAIVGVGVVEARVHATGETAVDVTGNTVNVADTKVIASSGRQTGNADEALRLNANAEAYSGTACGLTVNLAEISNTTQANVRFADNTINNQPSRTDRLDVDAMGYGVYDANSDVAGGAVVNFSGNTEVQITHGVSVSNTVKAASSGLDVDILDVTALNEEKAKAQATSYGGAILVVEASTTNLDNAADIYHTETSTTEVTLEGTMKASEDIRAVANTVNALETKVDNIKGAVGGGSGAAIKNKMQANTTVNVADNATLTAGGDIELVALSQVELGGIKDSDGKAESVVVESAVYGALTGTGIHIDNQLRRINEVRVGDDATLIAQDRLALTANAVGDINWRVRALSAGLIEGSLAEAKHEIFTSNSVDIDQGARLENRNVDQKIILSAAGDENYVLEAVGDVQGAFVGSAGASAKTDYERINSINVAQGATILGVGDVALLSGQDASEQNANLYLNVYAHAYNSSVLGTADSSYTDDFQTTDKVNVAGDVIAARSITVYADQGDVETKEAARRYTFYTYEDWGDVELASTASGRASSNMTEKSSVNVSGSLQAGTQTKFDLEISGVVDLEMNESPTISAVGQTTTSQPLIDKNDSNTEATITYGEVSVANQYWERHKYLLDQMTQYSVTSATSGDQSIYQALKAEDDYLVQQMLAKGFATISTDGQVTFCGEDGEMRLTVSVSDVMVSGGNVDITSSTVTGGGKIYANSADGIRITNTSNMALALQDVVILDEGGHLTFNGFENGTLDGFAGEIRSKQTSERPYFEVTSKFDGDVTLSDGSYVKTMKPDVSVTLNGDIINHAGDLTIISGRDILSTAHIAAGGSLNLDAAGSVTQSYASGITNTGGSVTDLWKEETDAFFDLAQSGLTTSSSEQKVGKGSIIAGGDIVISGDMININGLIQSGFAEYGISLDTAEVQNRINAIDSQWKKDGQPQGVNVRTNAYLVQEGGHVWDAEKNRYVSQTAAWYDPVNQRIVIDDIDPQGGHVYITGVIVNTGGGRIVASDGHATVNVKAGQYDLQTGYITTGTVSGLVRITDLSYISDTVASHVTEITRNDNGDSVVKSWDIDKSNGSVKNLKQETSSGSVSYAPKSGLLYTWALGQSTTTTTVATSEEYFTIWGAWDKDKAEWTTQTPTTEENERLDLAETIGTTIVRQDKNNTSPFYAWSVQVSQTEPQEVIEQWTEYANWTHYKGWHYAVKTTTTGEAIQYLYTVKADNAIGVDLVGGGNSISLSSQGNIFLAGHLTAQGGTVTVDAGGSITNTMMQNGIVGAKTVTLKADKGSIGTTANAIRLLGSFDETTLTAKAAGAIVVDASQMVASNSTLHRMKASIDAGSVVNLTTSGDLSTSVLKGNNIALTSLGGSIDARGVEQLTLEDHSQRFDATAKLGSVSISAKGDLGLGVVAANDGASGTVSIETTGSLTDALPRDDEDRLSVEERTESWIEAGILGKNGTTLDSRYESDLAQAENEIKAAWDRYEQYQSMEPSTMGDALQADYAQLSARFGSCTTVDEAIALEKATSGTLIYQIEASKDGYRAWTKSELIYAVADSIMNPSSDTSSMASVPNIEAGGAVSLKAANVVGEEMDSTTFDLTASMKDANGELTDEGLKLYQTLARADASDVVWDKTNKTVTVSLKRPITVSHANATTSSITAEGSSVYLQTLADEVMRINSIKASDTVRLTAGQGLEVLNQTNLVEGKFITLHAGNGSIASGTTPLNLSTAADGWVAATAVDAIYLTETSGDLVISSLATDGHATLKSDGSILSRDMGEADLSGVIKAQTVTFDTDDSLGDDQNALRLDGVQNVDLNSTIVNAYLTIDGLVTTTIDSSGEAINASGVIDIEAEGGVLIAEAIEATGHVAIDAGQNVTTDAITSEESVTITAGQAVTLADAVQAKKTVSVTAQGDVSTQAVTTTESGAGITLTSTVGSIDVNGDLTVSDTSGDVVLHAAETVDIDNDLSISAKSGWIDVQAGDLVIGSRDTFVAKGIDFYSTKKIILDQTTFDVGEAGLSIASDDSLEFYKVLIESDADVTLTATNKVILDAAWDPTNNVGESQIKALGDVIISGSEVSADALQLSAEDVSVTATTGGVSMEASRLDVDSLTSSAVGDISLTDAEMATMSGILDLSSTDGSVNFAAVTNADATQPVTVGSGTITAANDVTMDHSSMKATTGAIKVVATAGTVDIQGSTLEAKTDISLKARALEIDSDQTMTAGEDVSIDMTESITAEGLIVKAKTASIIAQEGTIDLDNGQITVSEALTVAARDDVTVQDATISQMTDALAITSTNGRVDLSVLKPENSLQPPSLQAGSIAVSGGSGVDIEAMTLTATNGSIDLTSSTGSIEADGTTLSATNDVRMTAGGIIELTRENAGGTQTASTVTASNDVSMMAQDEVVAAGSAVSADSLTVQSATGAVDLADSTITVTDSLAVEALKSVDLSGSNLPHGSTNANDLTGDMVITSAEGDVDLTQTGLEKLTVGGDIDVEAAGQVQLSGDPLTWQAQKDITLKSTDINLGDGSSLTAIDGHLTVDASDDLTVGDDVGVSGATVDLEGDTLTIGNNGTFTSTNGDLDIVASGDATLGGTLTVNASSQTPNETAEITIGADETFTVAEDGLTIKADQGSVTVFGGQGMTVHNDLTIYSQTDTTIQTTDGNLSIGDNAVITAGISDSDFANDQYGRIEIDAGGSLSIGGTAKIRADRLNISARDHVTFGSDAILYGVTDGVRVTSNTGDITMGANLVVLSNQDKTSFTALNGKIHINEQSTLTSVNSSIEFKARDIVFDADFTATGKGLVLNATGDLDVADHATIKTVFDPDANTTPDYGAVEGWLNTRINAQGNVTFGEGSSFETTMLLLTAGVAGDGQGHIAIGSGDLTFGKNAKIKTSQLGVTVVANGDVTFAEGATFNTYGAQQQGSINVLAYGSVSFGDNATLLGTVGQNDTVSNVIVKAHENISFEGQTRLLSKAVNFETVNGDIVFGDQSTLVTWQDPNASTTNENVDQMTFDAGRDIDMMRSVNLFATSNLSMSADRHVNIGSDSWIYSDLAVDIAANGGDLTIADQARIGSSNPEMTRFTDKVNLRASGDIVQTVSSGNKGIVAETLTATAGGSVILGAVDQTSVQTFAQRLGIAKGGNIANNVTIDAGQDVIVSLASPIDSTLSINSSRAGRVDGDLIVHGQGNALTFANDLDVRGDASIHAKRVALKKLAADGLAELSTNFYDATNGDGIVADEVHARRVVMLTEEGNIRIGQVTSSDDLISIARSSLSEEGTVHIDMGDSADTLNVYNGRGTITTNGLHATELLHVITGGENGELRLTLTSDTNRVRVIENAEMISKYLQTDYLDKRDAANIVPGFVPIVNITKEIIDDPDLIPDHPIDDVDTYTREGLRYDVVTGSLIGLSGYEINNYWLAQMQLKNNAVFFDFDSDKLRDEGRVYLDRLVKLMQGLNIITIKTTGHTDRLGSDAYNQALSEKRAEAVKRYLIERGVDARKIQTAGHGRREAIVDCANGGNLILCLSPNRRTSIDIDSESKRRSLSKATEYRL